MNLQSDELGALVNWAQSATDPARFIQKCRRAVYTNPSLATVPSLHLSLSHAYAALTDLNSALAHLLEANRLVLTVTGQYSCYIQLLISDLSISLALISFHHTDKDPVKCLTVLNRIMPNASSVHIFKTMLSAKCLLKLELYQDAVHIFMSLASLTNQSSLYIVCARLYTILGQFDRVVDVLNQLKHLVLNASQVVMVDEIHDIINDQIRLYLIDIHHQLATNHRQYPSTVTSLVDKGLALDPSNIQLLTYKADSLLQSSRYEECLGFIKSVSRPDTSMKFVHMRVQCLEHLFHKHRSSPKTSSTAQAYLTELINTRPSANPQDALWACRLEFNISPGTHLIPKLEALLTSLSISCDEIGVAESMLCLLYARDARTRIPTPSKANADWDVILQLLDHAILFSYPRFLGLGTSRGKIAELLLQYPTPLKEWPAWAQQLPEDCHAKSLWHVKSQVLHQCRRDEEAVHCARAALVYAPTSLELKKWLLDLTHDQQELAHVAQLCVARRHDGPQLAENRVIHRPQNANDSYDQVAELVTNPVAASMFVTRHVERSATLALQQLQDPVAKRNLS